MLETIIITKNVNDQINVILCMHQTVQQLFESLSLLVYVRTTHQIDLTLHLDSVF